jgi:hypothetical protein
MPREHRKRHARYSDESGGEVVSSQPVEAAIRLKKPPTIQEQIKEAVRNQKIADALAGEEAETFEEANDFDVGDDYEPDSGFEIDELEGYIERQPDDIDSRLANVLTDALRKLGIKREDDELPPEAPPSPSPKGGNDDPSSPGGTPSPSVG